MPKFEIGDVVALKTHPFSLETNNIIISGEYQMLPPLMVVIEVIVGTKIKKPSVDMFKCIWFSTKQNEFKDSFFTEDNLKLIKHANPETEVIIGDTVSLLTMPIELSKRRSFLNTETQINATRNTQSVSGLLTFISPLMSVIEITNFDPVKDKKTSPEIQVNKIYPKRIAKCKWYNPISEKFSETWIALDALFSQPIVSEKLISLIEKAIETNRCLKFGNQLIKPTQLSNRSGIFYLNCFDYIIQQYKTVNLGEIIKPKYVKNPIKAYSPMFKKKTVKGKKVLKLTVDVEKMINLAIARTHKNYISIKYKDKFGNITHRTLSNYKFIFGEDEMDTKASLIKYLNGFCFLRNAERNFRLDSIFEAIELDMKF